VHCAGNRRCASKRWCTLSCASLKYGVVAVSSTHGSLHSSRGRLLVGLRLGSSEDDEGDEDAGGGVVGVVSGKCACQCRG